MIVTRVSTVDTVDNALAGYSCTIDDASSGDNFTTTDGIFEGLDSLQLQYSLIISDCIKSVFGISKPKDWKLVLIHMYLSNGQWQKSSHPVFCYNACGGV